MFALLMNNYPAPVSAVKLAVLYQFSSKILYSHSHILWFIPFIFRLQPDFAFVVHQTSERLLRPMQATETISLNANLKLYASWKGG